MDWPSQPLSELKNSEILTLGAEWSERVSDDDVLAGIDEKEAEQLGDWIDELLEEMDQRMNDAPTAHMRSMWQGVIQTLEMLYDQYKEWLEDEFYPNI